MPKIWDPTTNKSVKKNRQNKKLQPLKWQWCVSRAVLCSLTIKMWCSCDVKSWNSTSWSLSVFVSFSPQLLLLLRLHARPCGRREACWSWPEPSNAARADSPWPTWCTGATVDWVAKAGPETRPTGKHVTRTPWKWQRCQVSFVLSSRKPER